VVVKVPRFAFEKFPGADPVLTTHMKSVGEAMAIGRSFPEALQKALRSLESRGAPLSWREAPGDPVDLLARCAVPHDGRLAAVHQAIRAGVSVPDLAAATGIDAWFIDQIKAIEEHAERLASGGPPDRGHPAGRQAGGFLGLPDRRHLRHRRGAGPPVAARPRRPAGLPHGGHLRGRVRGAHAVPVLHLRRGQRGPGRGPPEGDHPGQRAEPDRPGIEFDYACVHACFALSAAGYETVMVNCNPETVSTDYDTSDRLYFEPLTLEDVLEVVMPSGRAGRSPG
jgi:carbamoyl-phosphate synthase large subunit